jgi:hypothetical protein
MRKTLFTAFVFLLFIPLLQAQTNTPYELGVGLRLQKTEQLYWENGVTADFTSDFLLQKKIHLKMSYVTSRIGSAFMSNAVRQDYVIVGADWRFRSNKDLQIFAGLNTGLFLADMELPEFNVLPHNSMLLQLETGLFYKFKFPLATSLSVGYNLINGNGVNIPGTLFPVYYQLSAIYYISK